jgi:1,5-anhydro-D-fructose reductase (1,5-anhydro-D-mannitol-forming)
MIAVKWGLIGASNIAEAHMIPAIRSQGGEIESVLSTDEDRAKNYAEQQKIPHHTTLISELLERVDAVYISTTNEKHKAQVIAAAVAGKHILCEKPLATNLADAKEMVAATDKAAVVFATNHHLRNSIVQRTMRDYIKSGKIGTPLFARVFHAVYLPEHLQGWRLHNPESGGGVTVDITVHDTDTLRFVLDDNPIEVTAQTQQAGMSANALEDGVMGVIKFSSGLLAQFHDAFTTKYARTGLEVHGTKGSLIATDCMTDKHTGKLALRNDSGEKMIELTHEPVYEISVREFQNAIAGNGKPSATGDDGIYSLATALAALQSAKTQKQVTINI